MLVNLRASRCRLQRPKNIAPKRPFHLFPARPLCPTREYVAQHVALRYLQKEVWSCGSRQRREERAGGKEGSKSWARSVSDFLHSVSNQTFPQYHTPQQQGKTIAWQPGIGGVKTTVDTQSRLCDFVFVQLQESPNHPVPQMHYGAAATQPGHMSGGKCIVLYRKHLNSTQPHTSSGPPSTDL